MIRLAIEVAARWGTLISSEAEQRNLISKPEQLPTIYRRDDAALWVARYYTVIIHDDAPRVQCLYPTRSTSLRSGPHRCGNAGGEDSVARYQIRYTDNSPLRGGR